MLYQFRIYQMLSRDLDQCLAMISSDSQFLHCRVYWANLWTSIWLEGQQIGSSGGIIMEMWNSNKQIKLANFAALIKFWQPRYTFAFLFFKPFHAWETTHHIPWSLLMHYHSWQHHIDHYIIFHLSGPHWYKTFRQSAFDVKNAEPRNDTSFTDIGQSETDEPERIFWSLNRSASFKAS